MELHYEIVDVFAEEPLAGNQLAVVFAPPDPSQTLLQAIAREMNFSETTFVSGAAGAERVRIFTPANELPFAGHPVLGTAAVLRLGRTGDARRDRSDPPPDEVVINLPSVAVRVRFDDEDVAWFDSPPARQIGQCDRAQIAAQLGLAVEQLTFDAITAWDIGPRFVLVEVADLPALRALRVTTDMLRQLSGEFGGFTSV